MGAFEKPKRSILSDVDWEQICSFFDENGNLLNGKEFDFRTQLEDITKKYIGPDSPEEICPICGNKKPSILSWCKSCEAEFFLSKRIRMTKYISRNTAKKGRYGTCIECGKQEAIIVAKGLCKQCYRRRYNQIKDSKSINASTKKKNAQQNDKVTPNTPEPNFDAFRRVEW